LQKIVFILLITKVKYQILKRLTTNDDIKWKLQNTRTSQSNTEQIATILQEATVRQEAITTDGDAIA
jgi:hypothetical protein